LETAAGRLYITRESAGTAEGEPGAGTEATSLRWYKLRWRIERYFDALKNGTRIKDRRLDHADDLKKCLAFEAPAASGHPEALAGTENPLVRRQYTASPQKMEKENKYG